MKKQKVFNPDVIKKEQYLIDKEIANISNNLMYDGIVDIDTYCKTPIKILWILKEVNDTGNYDQREAFRDISMNNHNDWRRTLDPVIYISYSLLNNFMTWQELSYINDKPEMLEVLKQIAYINIKKEPGGSTSNDKILIPAYEKYKEIIKRQINIANPDIIIGGGTLQYLYEDYGISPNQIKAVDGFGLGYYDTPDRLFMKSYHPAYLFYRSENDRGEYYNAVIRTVKDWHKNNI